MDHVTEIKEKPQDREERIRRQIREEKGHCDFLSEMRPVLIFGETPTPTIGLIV